MICACLKQITGGNSYYFTIDKIDNFLMFKPRVIYHFNLNIETKIIKGR